MKKSLIALALVAALGSSIPVRARTRDVAFQFRMGAGFPGDINRVHPFSVAAGMQDGTTPIRKYGDPALINAAGTGYRGFTVGDTATKIAGVLVRPYPTQQLSGGMSAALGTADAPTSGVIDVMEDGYIMVQCNDFAANPPKKGQIVTVRIAATSGNKIQGGFHAATDTTNTVTITNARWNSTADANGVAEIRVFGN